MVDIGETSERYVFVEESEQTINECVFELVVVREMWAMVY